MLSKKIFIVIITLPVFWSCVRTSEYQSLVERELSKGIRKDTLFLDVHFGMSKKDFYVHCWQLNKEGIVWQGSKNMTVLYEIDELPYPATMDFYPNFHNDTIYEMPVTFIYKGWAPWNKHLSSDSLQLEVVDLLEQWHGDGFIEVEHPQRGATFVKVDGNRRILVWKDNDSDVKALYTDLLIKKELENSAM